MSARRRRARIDEAGPHEVVLLTVKAHQVGPIAADLRHLIGPKTVVVTMQNGIPWWYFLGGHGQRDGVHEARLVRSGDQGVLTPEGYLAITGRLKEIINRGGKKSRRARSTRL